ncbi:hypothetical protein IWC96_14590 [Brevundimonas sp. BAL450]|uniref:hypothetical protein n=1 Tax=Brevundimonas sp. BAL450 TaxID=1708162 RepID=UPI0018C9D086|nr:hypothetical protein [Brevundimonas sp. BAL450]MBG7616503.1 hypothetical protein [Brevundimonas sp. BAL450]
MEAKFTQSRSDMHWSLYAGEDGFVRWGGYDDQNWWENVAKSDHARTRVGKATGRAFVIDFDTCQVEVREPATGAA